MHLSLRCTVLVLCVVALCLGEAEGQPKAPRVEYARDIRPILANHCFTCHGVDAGARKGKLRLDIREDALKETRSGKFAIVPGKPDDSELLRRIHATEPSEVMPPAKQVKRPTDADKKLLRTWIEQGAEYQAHWAFVAPKRPELPRVKNASWPQNPIDAFILARLEAEGLAPSAGAERHTLVRRATLELTGLPPTPAEVDAALRDNSETWFEKVIDRLLASPHFGERMALPWLDLARYADTNGYNNDEERTMWVWRDWVIDAFNDNMPFDRFLTEQLAGDLFPNPTPEQKVATGFNRNHVLTTEGGIFPEEYRVEYVADRTHTTATVFLGLSMNCARCHDHKYDPFSQADYYRFFAFFNNQPDQPVNYNSKNGAADPAVKVPSRRQKTMLDRLAALQKTQTEMRDRARQTAEPACRAWLKNLTSDVADKLPTGLALHLPLDDKTGATAKSGMAGQPAATIRGPASWGEGKLGGALLFEGKTSVEVPAPSFDRDDAFSLSAWVYPSGTETMAVLARMDEANAFRGYDLLLDKGKVEMHLVHRWPDDAIKIVTREAISSGTWHHIAATYDGSGRAAGLRINVDGKQVAVEVLNDKLAGSMRIDGNLLLGNRGKSLPFKGRLDDVRLYDFDLASEDVGRLAQAQPALGLPAVARMPEERRTASQQVRLRRHFFDQMDPESTRVQSRLAEIVRERQALEGAVPLTMVMQEMPKPRQTFLLKRGQYDQPGSEVHADVPGSLPPLSKDSPRNRLGLARWMTDPGNPLTSRVAVNRLWEMLFGAGIVETVEDVGLQGSLPSHPELLDWLATELVASGWNVKATLKLIMTSATYRQSSTQTPLLAQRDPGNRLLGRFPRLRLPAEMVRDNALSVAGLLTRRVGGPSVRPYQPSGLWQDVSVERRAVYVPSKGDDLYRRSMYTFWKRTCPPPALMSFDAPDRETCVVRRARTNTPLQALVLLNEPTYIEAARKLAERVLRDGGADDAARLDHAFRLVVARPARAKEAEVLLTIHKKAFLRFFAAPLAAEKLLAVGESPRDLRLEITELAAWTTVANLILNLDEAITKE